MVVAVGLTEAVTAASMLTDPVLPLAVQFLLSVTVTLYTVPEVIVGVPDDAEPKPLFHAYVYGEVPPPEPEAMALRVPYEQSIVVVAGLGDAITAGSIVIAPVVALAVQPLLSVTV